MSTKRKKRKYTFRKGQKVPYESTSIMHEVVKSERERAKELSQILSPTKTPKKQKKKQDS